MESYPSTFAQTEETNNASRTLLKSDINFNIARYLRLGPLDIPHPILSRTCRYRYYPTEEPFTADQVLTPNSICVFPDGRTSLADAISGPVDIIVYWLQYFTDGAYWTNISFDDAKLVVLGNFSTCDAANYVLVDQSGGLPILFQNQSIYGGGHSPIDSNGNPESGAVFLWAPSRCGSVPLELFFNSPDINGDLIVNLADIQLFSIDRNSGVYNYRSDFNFDGTVDLSDIGILSNGYGTSCQ